MWCMRGGLISRSYGKLYLSGLQDNCSVTDFLCNSHFGNRNVSNYHVIMDLGDA